MSKFRKLTETILNEYDPFGAAYDQWRTTDPKDDEPDYDDEIEQRWAIRSLNDWADDFAAPDVDYALYIVKDKDGNYSTTEDCANDYNKQSIQVWENEAEVLQIISEIKKLNTEAKLQPVQVYGHDGAVHWYEDFNAASERYHDDMSRVDSYGFGKDGW